MAESRLASAAAPAGVVASILAALCCAGVPAVVGVLSAVGLGFLRTDAILLPLIAPSLGIALWGLARDRSVHGAAGPLVVGVLGGAALIAGVFLATPLVALGGLLLVAAVAWNIVARQHGGGPGRAGPRGGN